MTHRMRLGLGLGVVVLAFWPTWFSFPSTWKETGWHNVFVVAFCGWLLWRDRRRFYIGTDRLGLAVLAVVALSMLWLLGYLLHLRVLHQAAVPALLAAWLLATAGWRTVRVALPVFATFQLAVPLWGTAVRPLQSMTVLANQVLLGLTGIEADIQGDYIVLRAGVLWVARGCSGLNFFQVGLLLGIVYALLFVRTWRVRLWVVALAAAMAIVSNWLRVFGLVIIADVTEMQSPIIAEHGFYGWVIFAVMLAVFFVIAGRLERLDARTSGGGTIAEETPTGTVDAPLPWKVVALPTAAALTGPLLYLVVSGQPSRSDVPATTPGIAPSVEWRPVAVESSEVVWGPKLRGTDEQRHARWQHTDGRTVDVHRLLYFTQRQGKELITDGNALVPDSMRLGGGLVGPVDSMGRMVNVTVVKGAAAPRLVWSWYRVASMATHSGAEAKLFELIGAFSGDRTAELVAISTTCDPDDECRAASTMLFTFVTGRASEPTTSPESR
jgi:EpsI family protein